MADASAPKRPRKEEDEEKDPAAAEAAPDENPATEEKGPVLPAFIDPDQYAAAIEYADVLADPRMFGGQSVPSAVRIHAAVKEALAALGTDPDPPAESLAVYDTYLADAQHLHVIGWQQQMMGRTGPSSLFNTVIDLLIRCDTRKTAEQSRAEHLAAFAAAPWSAALGKISREAMQALPGYEGLPPEETPVDFVAVGDADEPKSVNIKINLPSDEASFGTGNGEGTWGLVHPAVKARSDADEEANGHLFVGVLDNQPGYPRWRHLEVGDPVVFELRGTNRAVAILDQASALANDADKLLLV